MVLTRYEKKVLNSNKNNIDTIIQHNKVCIGDENTILESTGNGTYRIITPSSSLTIDSAGNFDFSGTVKVNATDIDDMYYSDITGTELYSSFTTHKLPATDEHSNYYNQARLATISSNAKDGKDHSSLSNNPHSVDWADVSSAASHDDLQNLDADDHTQYYNQTRIATISSQAKNAYDFSSNSDLFTSANYMTSSTVIANYYPSSEGNTLKSNYDGHSGNTDLHFTKASVSLSDLSDTDDGDKGPGTFLMWDGDNWIPSSLSIPDIPYFCSCYQASGGTIITSSWVDIPWEAEYIEDSDCFYHAHHSEEIKLKLDGVYKINYHATLYNSSASLFYNGSCRILVSSSGWYELAGTRGAIMLNRKYSGSCDASIIKQLSSGSKIKLQGHIPTAGSDVKTVPSGCSIVIERVKASL